jgi:hypothetical protein
VILDEARIASERLARANAASSSVEEAEALAKKKNELRALAFKVESLAINKHHENALQSGEMLRAVIGGETYEAVAMRFGVSRTAVERRIKSVAVQLTQVVGVDGLKEEGAAFVRRLRQHRDAILVALEGFEPQPPVGARPARVQANTATSSWQIPQQTDMGETLPRPATLPRQRQPGSRVSKRYQADSPLLLQSP